MPSPSSLRPTAKLDLPPGPSARQVLGDTPEQLVLQRVPISCLSPGPRGDGGPVWGLGPGAPVLGPQDGVGQLGAHRHPHFTALSSL